MNVWHWLTGALLSIGSIRAYQLERPNLGIYRLIGQAMVVESDYVEAALHTPT